ncbi:MAG: hypothetical protein KF745_10215 [Phycisphaeraceae bacterium]|nr:hypothetical protein [Phycisphaeraceae bacterium]
MTSRSRALLLPVILALAIAPGACSSGSGGYSSASIADKDPITIIKDPKARVDDRVIAVDEAWTRAAAGTADRTATREVLKSVVWAAGTPSDVRLRAVERLLDDQTPEGAADTRRLLRLRLPTETDWKVITLICETASKNGWTEYAPTLARSWSRTVPQPADDQRPERAALLALFPGKTDTEIVYDIFVGRITSGPEADTSTVGKEWAERARRDAWEVLGRIDKDGSSRTRLIASDTEGPANDPALAALRASAKDLRCVPVTGPELDWLLALRADNPTARAWWTAATAAVAGLTAEQAQGLRLRHIEPIRWTAANHPERLTQDRSALVQEASSRLADRRYYARTADRSPSSGWPSGRFVEAEPKLAWADLVTLLTIDDCLKDAAVRVALFEQVAIDQRDTSTEYGGVLQDASVSGAPKAPLSGWLAISFPPRAVQRIADNRFVASEEMVDSSPRCLAHYHFHVQRPQNAEYAGPGPGDFEYSTKFARNTIVFTSIDSDTLDLDYYQENGAVVDLGTVTR